MFATQSAASAAGAVTQPEAYSYPRPIWRVTVAGKDVTSRISPRLISLTITECRSDQADQLDLILDDHDGRLELPARGVSVRVLLGWEGTGLVDKGKMCIRDRACSPSNARLNSSAKCWTASP